jgi:GDPmannose 4,6-dehydratase
MPEDYVRAMWMMLQVDSPDDYVVGTGISHSVREFVTIAFDYLGLDYEEFVDTDQRFYRPAEIHDLVADASKARSKLGWDYQCQFADLVQEMVENDLKVLDRDSECGEKRLENTKRR